MYSVNYWNTSFFFSNLRSGATKRLLTLGRSPHILLEEVQVVEHILLEEMQVVRLGSNSGVLKAVIQ